jgi:hypothetical protein
VPSPAAITLLLTSLVTTAGPLVVNYPFPNYPFPIPCNYPFPIPTHRAIVGGAANGVVVVARATAPATASWRDARCR